MNTPMITPSIESRFARLVVKYYIGPAFSSDATFKETRRALENISSLAILPWGMEVEKVKTEGLHAELIMPPDISSPGKKIVLYLHGGGFVAGSPATYRDLAARISKSCGIPVLVPDYRLAPENQYPAANRDCLKIYRLLLQNGYSSNDIVIGGDSAGGCLALMTLLSLREVGEPLPAAVFFISPLTDAVHLDGESMKSRADTDPLLSPDIVEECMASYIGDIDSPPSILSPIRHPLTGMPPMLIQVGSDEILLSDSTRLAERAKQAGVDVTIEVWGHMWHVFQAFGIYMPESRIAVDHIGAFIKKHIQKNQN
jgi:acetyl esterase/lipase